jgi:hypothetical protein
MATFPAIAYDSSPKVHSTRISIFRGTSQR